jgi:hypothetical protein
MITTDAIRTYSNPVSVEGWTMTPVHPSGIMLKTVIKWYIIVIVWAAMTYWIVMSGVRSL